MKDWQSGHTTSDFSIHGRRNRLVPVGFVRIGWPFVRGNRHVLIGAGRGADKDNRGHVGKHDWWDRWVLSQIHVKSKKRWLRDSRTDPPWIPAYYIFHHENTPPWSKVDVGIFLCAPLINPVYFHFNLFIYIYII